MPKRFLAIGFSAVLGALLALPSAQAQQPTAQQGHTKQSCSAAAKAQKLTGDARSSFMKSCLSGATQQPGTQSANPPAPSGTSVPPKATASSLAAGQFASEAEARRHCPSDQVVWANTKSKVYHLAGTRDYGHTKAGAYMCQADTIKAGYRAAQNEKPAAQKAQ